MIKVKQHEEAIDVDEGEKPVQEPNPREQKCDDGVMRAEGIRKQAEPKYPWKVRVSMLVDKKMRRIGAPLLDSLQCRPPPSPASSFLIARHIGWSPLQPPSPAAGRSRSSPQ